MIDKMTSINRASGYFLIGSACLLLMLPFGYRSSFGLFVKPITDANDRGRDVITLALVIQNLFWGIVAVFAGGLADHFGNTKVIMGGTLVYALGMLMMGLSGELSVLPAGTMSI